MGPNRRKRQEMLERLETMPIPDKPQIPERESGTAYHLFQNKEGKYFWQNNPKTKGQQFETVEEAVNAMQGTEAWKDKSFQDLYGPNASRRAQTPEDWKALRKLREEYENRLRRRGEFVLKRGGKVSKRKGGGKVFYGYKKGGQV